MSILLKEFMEAYGIVFFIELLFDSWNEAFLLLMIFVLLISKMKDKAHNLIRKTEIPLSTELLLFYITLFFYNFFFICTNIFTVVNIDLSRLIVRLSVFLYYCAGGFQMLLLLNVIDKYVAKKHKNTKLHKIVNCFRAVQAVNYIFLFITPFTGFLYHIDKSAVHVRNVGYYVWQGLSIITLAFILSVVFIYKYNTDKFIKSIIITATIIPLASLISSVVVGINLNSFFIAIAAFVMFVMYVSNKTDVTIKYAADLQKSRDELEQRNLKLLLAQIQPHFIYNSIMALQSKSVDNPVLYHGIKSFGKYLRATLESLTDNPLVSFKDELNNIKAYLQLETLNYGDRLKVEYDIEFDDFMVPMLSVEPLVENAVRYGVGTYENALYIKESEIDDYYQFYYDCVKANLRCYPESFTGLNHPASKSVWQNYYLSKEKYKVIPTGHSNVRYLDVYIGNGTTDGSLVLQGAVFFTTAKTGNNGTPGSDSITTSFDGKTTGFEPGVVPGSVGADVDYTTDNTVDKYYTYNLTVTKTTTGNMADKNHQFPITVNMTKASGLTDDVTVDFSVSNDQATPTTNAEVTLGTGVDFQAKLANNGKMYIKGIPYFTGSTATYATVNSITELNDSLDKYTVSVLATDMTSTLAFANTPTDAGNSATTTVNTSATFNATPYAGTIAITNTMDTISPTGLAFRVALYVLMLAAGVSLIVLFAKRKNEATDMI